MTPEDQVLKALSRVVHPVRDDLRDFDGCCDAVTAAIPLAEATAARVRELEEAAQAVEGAWTTGHIRRDETGGDTSTVRGQEAMRLLRAALDHPGKDDPK